MLDNGFDINYNKYYIAVKAERKEVSRNAGKTRRQYPPGPPKAFAY